MSRKEVETKQQLPTTRGLTAWCYETSQRPFHIAAAGLLVGLESQVPGIYQRNLPPLKTHYGFTDREVEFFAIHIEAGLPDRGAAQHHSGQAGGGRGPSAAGHGDALAVHDRPLSRLRAEGRSVSRGAAAG